MKTTKITIPILGAILLLVIGSSCKKQDDFLNAKPQQSLSTIGTIKDIQNLLNNQQVFNGFADPGWGDTMSDDVAVDNATYLGQWSTMEQNAYIFSKQIFGISDQDNGWNQPYVIVYYSNLVLDALPKITASQAELQNAKGMALFFRAFAFYDLVQTYAMPYDSTKATQELGIPLRLTSDLNVKSIRANEQQCYQQITSDLQKAIQLLPIATTYPTLPNKNAATALLARIYLAMGKYTLAYKYSDASLQLNSQLSDYNSFVPTTFFLTDNSQYTLVEDIFHRTQDGLVSTSFRKSVVDSVLYSLYDNNDIRKNAFFVLYNGFIRFRGSYEFKIRQRFSGLATDEMYLIRAETSARAGNTTAAMNDLNTLLLNRYLTGTFTPISVNSAQEALNKILLERRKELCYRGVRWDDLRRLNLDPKYAVTITHVINGIAYTLPPNDLRYAMEIPVNEIQLSGIQQNPR